jgi:hypothetical protein
LLLLNFHVLPVLLLVLLQVLVLLPARNVPLHTLNDSGSNVVLGIGIVGVAGSAGN